jgi:hypothetical protein
MKEHYNNPNPAFGEISVKKLAYFLFSDNFVTSQAGVTYDKYGALWELLERSERNGAYPARRRRDVRVLEDYQRRRLYYDNFNRGGKEYCDVLHKFLIDDATHKKVHDFDSEGWDLVDMNAPRQGNGYDCGVFTCVGVLHLSRNMPFSFWRPRPLSQPSAAESKLAELGPHRTSLGGKQKTRTGNDTGKTGDDADESDASERHAVLSQVHYVEHAAHEGHSRAASG